MKRSRFYNELLLRGRSASEILGLTLFMGTLTILLCLLVRKLLLSPSEISLICTPALWIIFVVGIMRMVLEETEEEVRKSIFTFHQRIGKSVRELFYTKLIVTSAYATVLLLVELLIFFLLMGSSSLLGYLLSLLLVFTIALPGTVALSLVGALISVRVQRREIMMPIVVLPLLVILSIAAVSHVEAMALNTGHWFRDVESFWLWMLLGLSILSVLVSELACRGLFSIED